MSKIILSRKGYDDQYGGKPSIILSDGSMLSFPIPIIQKESMGNTDDQSDKEKGISSEELSFKGKNLQKYFTDLGHLSNSLIHHVDPDIHHFTGKSEPGTFGQSGAALSHLNNQKVGKDDIFLFFGTFCKTFDKNEKLQYEMMHSFHAIFGYLIIDRQVTMLQIESETELEWLKEHPHYINRNFGDYKNPNAIYIGKDHGYFDFSDKLRLTKPGYKKSYWELPAEFKNTKMTYHKNTDKRFTESSVQFMSTAKGQEFVFERTEIIEPWLQGILKHKSNSATIFNK